MSLYMLIDLEIPVRNCYIGDTYKNYRFQIRYLATTAFHKGTSSTLSWVRLGLKKPGMLELYGYNSPSDCT